MDEPVEPQRVVPFNFAPFAWGEGEPYDTYRLDKFLSNTETIMARRQMSLTDRAKRQLTASFDGRWSVDGLKKARAVKGPVTSKGQPKHKGKAR